MLPALAASPPHALDKTLNQEHPDPWQDPKPSRASHTPVNGLLRMGWRWRLALLHHPGLVEMSVFDGFRGPIAVPILGQAASAEMVAVTGVQCAILPLDDAPEGVAVIAFICQRP